MEYIKFTYTTLKIYNNNYTYNNVDTMDSKMLTYALST